MVLKKSVLLLLFMVMVSAPALSFAANCCCLKATQEKVTTNTEMPPCHEMIADQNQDQATTNICLCDAGLTTLLDLKQADSTETPAFLKMSYHFERHNPYVSHTTSPDNPPPIS